MIINFLVKSLCEKESVYVNNLGLFRKEYEPAHIQDGMITPPGYKVVFDPDYDGNGFAFTMFVSQKGGMLITEATTQIDQWVNQLKNALNNNKSVSFENFGTFALNDKGIITYLCDRIAELNTEYEGMEPVSFNTQKGGNEIGIKQEEETEGESGQKGIITEESGDKGENETKIEGQDEGGNEDQTENENENDAEAEDDKDNGENDDDDDDHKKHKGWLWLVLILLILALLAAAAYYFKDQLNELYNKYFGKTAEVAVEETATEPEPEIITPDTLVVDSLTINQDSLNTVEQSESSSEPIAEMANGKAQNQTQNVSQLPDGEKFFINYEKGKHYVIVGSFRSEKEVRQHIKERKLEPYNPKVVLQPKSKNMRICIGVFDTEEDADKYGRSTGLNYWVLK